MHQPSLHIVRQTSLSEEKVTKRGKTSSVFVVVKNSPFQLTVALTNALTNFNHLTFDISLIYDMPGVNKEVSFVSTKPVDYKPSLNDVGDEICFDVKIKVLSSHHEDNFFRLKLTVWDPNNDNFPQLSILSHPIKVISKPMNQRKTRKRAAPTRRCKTVTTLPPSPTSPPSVITPPLPSGAATACNPVLESTLQRVDVQQQETIRLLTQLLEREEERPAKRQKVELLEIKEEPLPTPDFEAAFSSMLRCYSSMSAEDKAENVRKLLRSLSARDLEQLEELFDLMGTAGPKSLIATDTPPAFPLLGYSGGHSDSCIDSCPHRMELAKIDQFYNEVFF